MHLARQQLVPVMLAIANDPVSLASAAHAQTYFMLHKVYFYCAKINTRYTSIVQKLSNK